LFGPFAAQVDGSPLARLRTRKGEWLFALLVLRHGREVQRDWLMGTLWPDSRELQASASLRQSLADLRRALGPYAPCLRSPGPRTVCLCLPPGAADVLEFDLAIRQGDAASLERAISLYRGPLLEGCAEEWIGQEREARAQAYLAALETLAAHLAAHGENAAAVRHLRLLVSADPLRESGHRRLMEALAGSGDYTAAAEVYRRLRLLLHRELNAAPDGQTVALYERLRAEARARSAAGLAGAGSVGTVDGMLRPLHAAQAAHPSAAPTPPRGRLPSPLTAFVGRQREVRELTLLLKDEAGRMKDEAPDSDPLHPSSLPPHPSRLVTLTGSGGVGKTRLAIRAAEELLDRFADGVWFVDLSPLAEGGLVPQAVATVLEARAAPGQTPGEAATQWLRSRRCLLVLDNCEHLVVECARLAFALLQDCPALRILATSRQSLGLAGEIVYRVPSLSRPEETPDCRFAGGVVPQSADPPTRHPLRGYPRVPAQSAIESLLQYDAVHLFVERAQQGRSDFTLTRENAPAVVQVCHTLDGIPLALELAATCLKALSVQQLAARLEDRFSLLTGGSRAALPRQQTLRATVDWSYDLLTDRERALLRRVAVFASGWSLEAAEAVCGDLGLRIADRGIDPEGSPIRNPQPAIRNEEVLPLLTSLVDKSLVIVQERQGETRYHLLETVRQYAVGRLQESGEHPMLAARHSGFFLALAEEAERHRWRPEGKAWLDRLETEQDNLRSAMAWSLLEPRNAEAALRLAVLTTSLFGARGHLSEARRWLSRALAAPGGSDRARADALRHAGGKAYLQGDWAEARRLLGESAALYRKLGETGLYAQMLLNQFWATKDLDDRSHEGALLAESLACFQEIGDESGAGSAVGAMGWAAVRAGNLRAARRHFEKSLTLFRRSGNSVAISTGLYSLAFLHCLREENEQASRLGAQSVALQSMRAMQDAWAYLFAGWAACRHGDLGRARSLLRAGLTISWKLGEQVKIVTALPMFAELALAEGRLLVAARLFGATAAWQEKSGMPMQPPRKVIHDRGIAAARASLGEEAYAAAWHQGAAMILEEAVLCALSDADQPLPALPHNGAPAPLT
jgi:non-specific serine/threonine protein kinase